MKIDFHTHAKLAKYLPFSKEYTEWLFHEALLAGLDAICLTEHFNTQGFLEVYQYIKDSYKKDGDSFLTEEGLRIFPGMEVDIAEGGHTLVIGDMDSIIEMNQRLEGNKDKANLLTAREWVNMVSEYDVIFGAAHPFREGGSIPQLEESLLKQFDFIDMNGKDTAEFGDENKIELSNFCDRLDCCIVAGSDTHQSFQYGCIYNVFNENCSTMKDLRQVMESKDYEIVVTNHLKSQVKSAGTLKRALKELHACGGDYVSVLVEIK